MKSKKNILERNWEDMIIAAVAMGILLATNYLIHVTFSSPLAKLTAKDATSFDAVKIIVSFTFFLAWIYFLTLFEVKFVRHKSFRNKFKSN